ncbi:hypothetical protein FNV43_RR07250 [Rhamnella rubrinervis]|uniref:GDSL esterase/lipase n=1 Tax=Rhamnella rubrinervis TaxID=2594499 RepID=A0A8K0HFH1_9ROSA|nr:hypothetical protein FNV43_RR07250 [Rhamnella rubrinervis]
MWAVCGLVALVLGLWSGIAGVRAAPQAPCYFIFGDSLVDNGNNNQLQSLARADYLPYGIDFGGPTGRFSNGKTTVDVIVYCISRSFRASICITSSAVGFDNYIPPYVNARPRHTQGSELCISSRRNQRRNWASIGKELPNHSFSSGQLIRDENTAANYLGKCIYSIGLGSNDYLNNYFMPAFYSTGNQFTPDQYADDLIQRYTQQLSILHDYGARKFVLFGVGQIGCSPSELAQNSPDGRTCVERINSANRIFNSRLKSLVDQFNSNTPDSKFIYIDSYGIFQDIINSPATFGFRVTNTGCCGVGRNNGQITCLPLQTPCQNRDEYLFWDAFHPTEAGNTVVGRRAYSAQRPSDAYPIDIRRLAQL